MSSSVHGKLHVGNVDVSESHQGTIAIKKCGDMREWTIALMAQVVKNIHSVLILHS